MVNNFLQGLFRINRAVKIGVIEDWKPPKSVSLFRVKNGVHLTKQGHVKWVRGIRGRLLPCLKECF